MTKTTKTWDNNGCAACKHQNLPQPCGREDMLHIKVPPRHPYACFEPKQSHRPTRSCRMAAKYCSSAKCNEPGPSCTSCHCLKCHYSKCYGWLCINRTQGTPTDFGITYNDKGVKT